MILKLITFLYTKYTILQARFSSCYSFIETETPNEGIFKNNRSWGISPYDGQSMCSWENLDYSLQFMLFVFKYRILPRKLNLSFDYSINLEIYIF